jgi:lysophospholipase
MPRTQLKAAAVQAAPPVLHGLARNPIPSGGHVGTFAGFDGAPVRYALWAATQGPRRGTMCCFPGRSEFIEKYFETIADLRRRGFAVAIMDWRGQGGSWRNPRAPRRSSVRDFSEYDRDLAIFMRDIVLPDCPAPFLALGHSMGAHVLLRGATQSNYWFDRIVLIAPMLALHPKRTGHSDRLVRLYAEISTLLGRGGQYAGKGSDNPDDNVVFEGNPLTSDRERFRRNAMLLEEVPELVLGTPTRSWLRAAYRSMARLNAPSFARDIQVPALVFVAGADEIVLPRAIEDFAARLKTGTAVILPTSRHEILQETDEVRARFWAAFDAYLGIAAEAA